MSNGEEERPGFEEDVQPNSEAVAAGEAIGELAGATSESTNPSAVLTTSAVSLAQSELRNPYMSEEDQQVEMKPVVVGPPGYGSPEPVSQAGRLVPIADHPLAPENAPEGAAISEDYGADVEGVTTTPLTTTAPVAPMTDLELASAGLAVPAEEGDYESMTVTQLRDEANSRGLTGLSGATKAELVEALETNDAESE